MIRISKWPGLITAASPYGIPAGAAVEQINAQSNVPGQLTVRPGMAAVTHAGAAPAGYLEIWGYSPGAGATEVVFGLDNTGELVRLTAPTVS